MPVLHGDEFEFVPGRAVELRPGKDVTLIACGIMVAEALEAAAQLADEGLDAAVLNIHTVKPLDVGAVAAAARNTGAIVTVEEHSIIGGLGSAVAEALVENLPVPMVRVGLRDVFGQSGPPAELMEAYGLTPGHIAAAARRVVGRK